MAVRQRFGGGTDDEGMEPGGFTRVKTEPKADHSAETGTAEQDAHGVKRRRADDHSKRISKRQRVEVDAQAQDEDLVESPEIMGLSGEERYGEQNGFTSQQLQGQSQLDSQVQEVLQRSSKPVIPNIDDSQTSFDNVMTQVDETWVKHKIKRSNNTRLIRPQSSNDLDDSPSDSGVIEKLELFNFMCHKAFTLEFGPQTNFIIGRNGSGKSAILTGISVALGAKATDTDRGNSLKNLIMHGKNVARAIVTIKNEGSDAYKPEEFGHQIIIERVLKREGVHSSFIKNSDNKTLSTKKKTIEAILDHFGITIANPMTILTQTEAKTFLAHSSDRDKYNSFMRGTRLQESFDYIKQLEANKNEIRQFLSSKIDVMKEKEEKFNKAKKVYESFKDSDTYYRKKEILVGKQKWYEYNDYRNKEKKAQSLLQQKLDEISNSNEKIAEIQDEISRFSTEYENLQQFEIERAELEYRQAEQLQRDAKTQLSNSKNEINSATRHIDSVKRNILTSKKEISELEKKIKSEQKRIESSSEETVEKYKSKKEKALENIQRLNTQKSDLTSEHEIAKREKKEIQNQFVSELDYLKKETDGFKRDIRTAQQEQQKNNPESSFEPHQIRLLRDVKANRFKDQLTGPLGLYIEMKPEFQEWQHVVESILQRTLTTYLADNYDAGQEITNRIKFHGTVNEVTIRKAEIFDFLSTIPQSQYPSVLDTLNVTDENLKCFLVDSMKLHSILLIPDRRSAQRELENDTHNLIQSAICHLERDYLRISKKNGTFQSDQVNVNSRIHARLRVVGDSPIQRLQRDLLDSTKLLKEKELEMSQKVGKLTSRLNDIDTQLKNTKHEQSELHKLIQKIDSKLESMTEGTSALESMLEQRQIQESNIALDLEKVEEYTKLIDRLTVEFQNQLNSYQALESETKKAKALFHQKTQMVKSLHDKIEYSKGCIKDINSNIMRESRNVEKLEGFLSNIREEIEKIKDSASKCCTFEEANLKPGVTMDSIEAELRDVEKHLEQIERVQQISKTEAERNFLEAYREHEDVLGKYKQSVITYNKLTNSLNERLDNLMQTTLLTFHNVESVFMEALRIRRFKGKIEFDIKKGTLKLKVATKENAPFRAVESFSGGEKSYGQIAFLFAIWGPMHSRVRGLDEFDVFMDNVNRKIALSLILKKVAENPKRQTIFITPLSVSNVDGLDSKTVNIHEISPPERANI